MHPNDLQPSHLLHNQRYRIIRRLDRGGFGIIYHAQDLTLNVQVAIKENQDASADAQRRFLREARLLAKLDHPSLPSVTNHFIEQDDPKLAGRQYLVMEFIPGEDLQEIIESKGAQDEKMVINWIEQVMDALAYMHTLTDPETGQISPMIHRDIKPANIKVTPRGKVYLVDFGLAKHETPDRTGFTSLGLSSGTHGYAPPEQYKSDVHTDERSDIYALGATCYHLLTGIKPVEAPTREDGNDLAAARKKNPKIKKRISDMVERAMAIKPADRYPHIRAMRDALSGKTKTLRQHLGRIIAAILVLAGVFNGGMRIWEAYDETQGNLCKLVETPTIQQLLGCSAAGSVAVAFNPTATPQLTATPLPTSTATFEPPATATVTHTPNIAQTAIVEAKWHSSTATAQAAIDAATATKDAQDVATAAAATLTAMAPTKTDTPTKTLTPRPTATPTLGIGSTYVNPVDGATYLYVTAGGFIMGSENRAGDESPVHTIYLDSYWIMEAEVTNAQYGKFMEVAGYTIETYWNADGWAWRNDNNIIEPRHWEDNHFNGDLQPVVGISWYEAEAYATWLSAESWLDISLPTEAQWEKAARGTEGHLYPWGNQWDGSKANFPGSGDGYQFTAPVGSYPMGASPYGVLDMVGNVWEWTAGWYADDYYQNSPARNPQGPASGERRVLRGGSWFRNPNYLRAASRNRYSPDYRNYDAGFRLVLHETAREN